MGFRSSFSLLPAIHATGLWLLPRRVCPPLNAPAFAGRTSPWVDWEIEYAQKNDKRIIGVWAHGESQCDVPDSLKKYADAVVGWQGNRIIDAIEGRINDWEAPDGTKQPPHTTIPRVTCR